MIGTRKMLKFTLPTLVFVILALEPSALAQTARIHSISSNGRVRVQREKRRDWTPTRQGIELYQGDQIWPDKGVRVYVRCSDLSQPVLVKAGVPSGLGSICITWVNRDDRGTQAEETLGGVDSSIPYLIAPRHSLLLSNTPLLRWNPVADAKEYTVEVRGSAGLMWKTQTKDTQIVYAGKPLAPGVPYSVIVRTNTGKSSQDDRASNREQNAANLEFRVLRQSEAASVLADVAKISAIPSSNEADALTLASLYSNYTVPESVINAYQLPDDTFETYSLTSEAIALLESLIQQGKQSPILHRTLGDLYWQTGLVRLAESHYLKAVDLVQGLEDLEDWTLAQYSLGQVYSAIDAPEQALQHYGQARVGYIFLGDTRLAEVLQQRIEKLKKTTAN